MVSRSRQGLQFHRHLLTHPAFAAVFIAVCAASKLLDTFAVVVVCLYALRQRPAWSLPLLLVGVLSACYLSMGRFVLPLFGIYQCLAYVQPFVLACLLRYRGRWLEVIIVSIGLNILVYAVVHGFFPHMEQIDQKFASDVLSQNGLVSIMGEQQVAFFVEMLLPIQLLINNICALSCVALARCWQSRMYYPEGFRKEVHGLRHNKFSFGLFVAVALLSIFWRQAFGPLLLLSVVLPVMVGLSFCHWLAYYRSRRPRFWLTLGYLLALVTMPFSSVLLMCISVVDFFYNLRSLVR